MGQEVRENLRRLVRIQETSRRIYFLTEMMRDIPANYNVNRESFDERTRLIDEKKARIEAIEKEQARNEHEREELQGRAAAEDERIRRVTTQREYEAIEEELRTFRERTGELETEYLKKQEDRERLDKELAELEEGCEEERARLEAERGDVEGRVGKAKEELSDLTSLRDKIVPDIHEELYDQFLRVVNNKEGVGITVMEGTACESCRMNLPPQMANDVQKCKDYYRCPYCSRFLYHHDLIAGAGADLQESKQAGQPRPDEG